MAVAEAAVTLVMPAAAHVSPFGAGASGVGLPTKLRRRGSPHPFALRGSIHDGCCDAAGTSAGEYEKYFLQMQRQQLFAQREAEMWPAGSTSAGIAAGQQVPAPMTRPPVRPR